MTNTALHRFRFMVLQTFLTCLCLILSSSGCLTGHTNTPAALTCQDSLGCVDIAPGAPVKIGVLQTLTGGAAPGGTEQAHSIELAVQKYAGKLLDHPIQLIIEDEHCSSEGGANAALRIVADPQIVGILGTNCSSAAITASGIMTEKGLVMISGANTSPTLTAIAGRQGADWQPGYYRTAWNDTVMGAAAAQFAYEDLKITRAAVVNAGDAYSKGLTDVFKQAFTALGGEIVLESVIDEDDPEVYPSLLAVQLSGAKLVFFPLSHPETGARLINQAAETTALKNVAFIGGEGMLSDIFLREVGANGVGVYITGPAAPDRPENDELRRAFEATYGAPPLAFYYSFAYDAAGLLLQALEKTAQRAPDGSLIIGRQALRDTLYATRDYQGVTGALTCDPFGDCGAARLNIVQVQAATPHIEALRDHVIYTYTANP